MKETPEGFITTKQASKLSGYTKDYVGQLARKGHLESMKNGRQRVVSIKDLFAYIADKEAAKEEEKANNRAAIADESDKAVVASTEADEQVEDDSNKVEINSVAPAVAAVEQEQAVSEAKADEPAAISKKIVSPWVEQSMPRPDSVSSQTMAPVSKLSAYSNAKRSVSSSATEFSRKQYSAKSVQRRLPARQKFDLLPMISASAVLVAATVFMFSLGTLSSQYAAEFENKDFLASVGSLNTLDSIAVGWFEIISNLL